ncbi:MAG: extracellular solute-binding protein [Thermomicrobiales bacterium]
MSQGKDETMKHQKLDRRTFLRGATATASAAAFAATGYQTANASGSRIAAPAFLRYQSDPIEIDFSHIWGTPPGEQAAENKHPADQLVDAFNALNLGVTVNSRTDSGNYFEVLQKAQAEMAAGNPPALVITPWSNINYAVEGLGVNNLEDVATTAGGDISEILGNLKEQVIGLVQVDDLTKGVPFAFSCPVIYYNNEIFTAAGVDPAALFATWVSVLELGPGIQEQTDGNPILGFATNKDWPAQSIIQSNGGQVLSDTGELTIASPESIAAMQAIADIDAAGLHDRSTGSEMRASFIASSLACFIGSIASLGGLRRDVTFDLQTVPFPVFEDKPRRMSSGGSFIGCYAQDDDQKTGAWEFLKYAVSQEGTEIWMQTGYLNATTFEIEVLPGQEPAYLQLEEGLTRETAWPGARAAEIQQIWGNYVSRIWANDISAEEGCNQAVDEIEPLLPSS